METRVKESKSEQIVTSVFQGWSFVNNYEYNRKGRIWVVWSPQVRVTPVFKSDQIITVSVLAEGETRNSCVLLSMRKAQLRGGRNYGEIL